MANITRANYSQWSTAINNGQLLPFTMQIIAGSTIALSNIVIIVCVLRFQALRTKKEFILLMMLAVADAINQGNRIPQNIYCIWALLSGRLWSRVTPLSCLLKPHMFVWLFTSQFASSMLVVISADRLLLVSFPHVYLKLKARYAYRVSILVFACCILLAFVGVAFIVTNDQHPTEKAVCSVTASLLGADKSPWRSLYYEIYSLRLGPFLALISVVMYACIYPINKMRKAKVAAASRIDNDSKRELERQRKLTKHLAISCACTLFFYCIPYQLAHFYKNKGMFNVAQVFFIVCSLNAFSNLIIYQWKIHEVRRALKYILQGKDLPPNVKLWPKATKTSQRGRGGRNIEQAENKL